MKLWFDVKKDSIDRTGKSETTYKKHNQDNVWKGGCEVNGLKKAIISYFELSSAGGSICLRDALMVSILIS